MSLWTWSVWLYSAVYDCVSLFNFYARACGWGMAELVFLSDDFGGACVLNDFSKFDLSIYDKTDTSLTIKDKITSVGRLAQH